MKNKAFSEKLRSRLSQGKYARWATDLTEETVEALLWAVGELNMGFGWSVDSLEDWLQVWDPVVRARRLEGLRVACEIVHGRELDVKDVQRRIREAVIKVLRSEEEDGRRH